MRIWRRRAWKRFAGVVKLQTIQFISNNCRVMICSGVSPCGTPGSVPGTWIHSSSHNWRNRSSLADECSGPWPSIPCGSRRTNPTCLPHFACPEQRRVSMVTWGLFYSSAFLIRYISLLLRKQQTVDSPNKVNLKSGIPKYACLAPESIKLAIFVISYLTDYRDRDQSNTISSGLRRWNFSKTLIVRFHMKINRPDNRLFRTRSNI